MPKELEQLISRRGFDGVLEDMTLYAMQESTRASRSENDTELADHWSKIHYAVNDCLKDVRGAT